MTALLVTTAADGAELDRLTLDDEGKVTYRTGAARDMVDGWRRRLGDTAGDDAALLAKLDGWSNGYIVIRSAGDTAAAAGDAG